MRQPHVLIHKKKFVFLAAIKSLRWHHALLFEARRLRRGISIKCRVFYYLAIAWPKSVADYFMRVSFSGDVVRVRTFRRAPARKPCGRQIKTAPEKMYRAGLPDEP